MKLKSICLESRVYFTFFIVVLRFLRDFDFGNSVFGLINILYAPWEAYSTKGDRLIVITKDWSKGNKIKRFHV